ncbi:MAG: glycosyltransferase family 2 protein [bacterium]
MTDLSVIIVSYNTKDLLLECLTSVFGSASGISCDIHVVDNGSIDGSADAVAQGFPNVRLIRNPDNRGFARACNQGIREAKGKYLLLLNSDAKIGPDSLREMIAFMDKTPDAGASGGQLIREDGSLQNSFDNFPDLCTELMNKSLLKLLFPKRYPGKHLKFADPVQVESLIGACMMVRREAMDAADLLDEGYFFFLEETDWCLRMQEKGWKIYFLPHVRILHLQGKSAARDISAARIEFYRSRYRFFRLHRSFTSRLILRAGLFLNLCIETLYSLLISLATGFAYRKEVSSLSVRLKLLAWHLLGCPDHWGLRGKAPRGDRG